jgi:hypothetical protein
MRVGGRAGDGTVSFKQGSGTGVYVHLLNGHKLLLAAHYPRDYSTEQQGRHE